MAKGSVVFNLPNTISWIRIVLSALIVLLLYLRRDALAFTVFVVATVSDYVDGLIARRTGQVTNLGKVLDQMSDKILLTSLMVVFVERHVVPAWYVVVLVFRDSLVSTVRMLKSKEGKVLAANVLGKAKTVSQMVLAYGVFFRELWILEGWIESVNFVALWLSTVLTVASGFVYIYGNRTVLND